MGRRTRIAEGIYRDQYGLAATVKVGNIQREHRYQQSTPLDLIRSWRTQTRAELDRDRPTEPRVVRGAVEDEGNRYITNVMGTQSHECPHLRAWYPRFGSIALHRLKRGALQQQIDTWHRDGVAARTIRHRCRLLRALYKGSKPCPVDKLRVPKLPPPRPVIVPLETIRTVAANLAASHAVRTHARFLILATTGQRPVQLGRTKPEDIDFVRKLWFVRSAKGGHPFPFPLNDEAIHAWKLLAAADAWGPFSTKKYARQLRKCGWPAGVRPYALRSSFAIDLLLNGADLGDIQGLLGHTQIETTRKHYAPVLIARLTSLTAGRTLGVVPAPDYQRPIRNNKESKGNHAKEKRTLPLPNVKKSA